MLYEVIKFVAPRGKENLYGDQVVAKQCCLVMVSTKATMKEVQLVEEERKVLKDVGKTPEAKGIEDFIHYELYEPSSDNFFLTGANLNEQ